jgi:capsular exopolysaccharide synthesis family protein
VESVDAPSALDLRSYLATLRARRWTILLITALTLGAAIGASLLQEPLYSSTARVLVQPLPSGPRSPVLQPVDPATEAEIVASEPVTALVRKILGSTEPTQVLTRDLEVTGVALTTTGSTPGARVLEITYTASDPATAKATADAFAEGYIDNRRGQTLSAIEAAQETVEERLQAASKQLQELQEQMDAAQEDQDESLVRTLEVQRNIVVTRLGTLQEELDALQPTATDRSGGAQMIEPAVLPSTPSSPDYVRNALLALVAGLGLGVMMAFVRERLDDRFRGKSDVEEALGTQVLAAVPRFKPGRKDATPLPVVESDPASLAAEAYRALRTTLQYVATQRKIKTLLVTSASAGEGKTVTSANLAVALAKAGRRVILVSGDLRRPTLDGYFSIRHRKGLSTWLSSEDSNFIPYIQDPGIDNLRIMASGPVPPDPAELLTSPRLVELIEQLEANSDFVIFDSPPVLAVADAAILTLQVDATILVMNIDSTPRSAATNATQIIEKAGGTLAGCVINALDPGTASYSYYGSTYYSSEYTAETAGGNGSEPAAPPRKRRSRLRARS